MEYLFIVAHLYLGTVIGKYYYYYSLNHSQDFWYISKINLVSLFVPFSSLVEWKNKRSIAICETTSSIGMYLFTTTFVKNNDLSLSNALILYIFLLLNYFILLYAALEIKVKGFYLKTLLVRMLFIDVFINIIAALISFITYRSTGNHYFELLNIGTFGNLFACLLSLIFILIIFKFYKEILKFIELILLTSLLLGFPSVLILFLTLVIYILLCKKYKMNNYIGVIILLGFTVGLFL